MRKIPVLGALLGFAAACVVPTDGCGCSPAPPPFRLHVAGTVATADAAPVSGLIVQARVYQAACLPADSGAVDVTGSLGQTDAQGRFAFEVATAMPVQGGCVRLRALRAASGAGVPATTVASVERTGIRVRPMVGGRPLDSLRVDLVAR